MRKLKKFIIIISITLGSVILFCNSALLQDGYSAIAKRAAELYIQSNYIISERRYSEAIQLRNQAKEIYKQAIMLKPDNPLAYDALGTVYDCLGQKKDAVEMFNRAIELDPNFSSAYWHLGLVYREKGNYQEAIVAFRQTLRIRPNDYLAYFSLG